ncbi:MAG: NAD-dependent epimerase/dehydratase family protein, partial [Catenulispora sp.]|nr:NAD-dependent epimerase/dehydratase family protein [Catenulispora sp.]
MVRTVAVTGAAGMLGSRLVTRLLSDGVSVRGIDLRPGDPVEGLEWTVADVRDADAMTAAFAGADLIIHTASALPSYPEPEIRSIIVGGTTAVFDAFRASGAARILHISSTAVYGLPSIVPTTEAYPREPVDAYSRAKAAAEEIAERHRADGLAVGMLRPKTFLGPGRMGLFAMLFEWAQEGRNFPVLGKGDVRIQMFALSDLVDAVVTVVNAPDDIFVDTYNVGAERFGTFREDLQAVLDAAGHGKRVVSLPARPALALLRGLERTKLSPVYGRLLSKLQADSYVSVEKAKERFGFAPKLSNQDAILASYEWWRSQRDAAP